MTAEQPVQASRETSILMFSDDILSARLLKQILLHHRYRVREVNKVSTLHGAIAQQQPGLILLDIIKPGEDVFALCQEIKSRAATALTPIIFVSAFQQVADKVHAFAVGGDDYLTKPFHPAEVLARVDHHLKVARLQQELEQEKAALERSYAQLRAAHERISLMSGVLSEHLTGKLLDGKYLLEAKIDSGGFGVVYRALHVSLQRPVAVKVLRLTRPDRAETHLERFRREGISACRVVHPNAVSVLDFGVSPEGIPYLVMELLIGQTLAARLEQTGNTLPIADCLRIVAPICEVLIESHAAGVVHRDIKPDNIFLHRGTEGEVVKVLDFGIANMRDTDDRSMTRLTRSDGAMGTALYMAPERLHSDRENGQSDVYSLAVMLYIMLCGRAPFAKAHADPVSTMYSHSYESPIPLQAQNPAIPAPLVALVMDGLAKDPKARPTAREFLARLRGLGS